MAKIKKSAEEEIAIIDNVMELLQGLSYETREHMGEIIAQRGVNSTSNWFSVLDLLASDLMFGYKKASTKKSKLRKSVEPGKDWDFEIPQERDFINEVYENGVVVGLELADRGAYRTFEYNGEHYEVYETPTLRDENNPKGIGFMLLQSPEPDYSVLTFDLFKQTITDYIHQWESERDWTLDDYTFHNNGNGHYTFSYDSQVYELMNYEDPAIFKDGLERALENAGFEWGETIEYDTYSDLGFYNHSEMKSTKKSKKPDLDISFEASVNSLRKTNYAKCGNINTIVKERK